MPTTQYLAEIAVLISADKTEAVKYIASLTHLPKSVRNAAINLI